MPSTALFPRTSGGGQPPQHSKASPWRAAEQPDKEPGSLDDPVEHTHLPALDPPAQVSMEEERGYFVSLFRVSESCSILT